MRSSESGNTHLLLTSVVSFSISAILILTDTPLDGILRNFFYPLLTGSTEAKPALLLAHLGLMCLLFRSPPPMPSRWVEALASRKSVLCTALSILMTPYLAQLVLQYNTPYGLKAGTLVVVSGGSSVGETSSLTHTHSLKACVGKVMNYIVGPLPTKYHYGSVLSKFMPAWAAAIFTAIVIASYVVLAVLSPLAVFLERRNAVESLLLSWAGFLVVLGAVDGGFMCKPLVIGLGMLIVWALGPLPVRRYAIIAVPVGLTPMLVQAMIRVVWYLTSPLAPNSVAWAVALLLMIAIARGRGR
ncbi:hypothetical protein [Methanopyrus sp.]